MIRFLFPGVSFNDAMSLADAVCRRDKWVGEIEGVPYIETYDDDAAGLEALGHAGELIIEPAPEMEAPA